MKRLLVALALLGCARPAAAVDLQPLSAQAERIEQTLQAVGQPLSPAEVAQLHGARTVAALERVLDRHVLFDVTINPEQRVSVVTGAAPPRLVQDGWTVFLVKVFNQAGTTAPLHVESPQSGRVFSGWWDASPRPPQTLSLDEARGRFIDVALYADAPFGEPLSGLDEEYRIVQIACSQAGKRDATFRFDVGAGTADLGFRNETHVLFDCHPAYRIKLHVRDEKGAPAMASFDIRDRLGRVYPLKSKRLAPDFFFQPQIYRQDGESLALPAGEYSVRYGRGPEYRTNAMTLRVAGPATLSVRLARWVDPMQFGWVSGDDHIHAAGCAHYNNPTQGVGPDDVERQARGEDLKVGCVLTWGPCFDYQSHFFTGKPRPGKGDVLRYDIEVSGFGSDRSGHLVLLGLQQGEYPGADGVSGWPTLGLNTLRWAKAQGAVTGCAHPGWGIAVPAVLGPTIPKFDGIGANEYIVDVTQTVPGPDGKPEPAIDFLGVADTPWVWEMNMWYHTLNAGFRTRISGETDFPCITEQRVGQGRVYVKSRGLDFNDWLAGLKAGRSYVSDGESHLMDFAVDGTGVGEGDVQARNGEALTVTAHVAALLPLRPQDDVGKRPSDVKPYWSLERARIGTSRRVPVELVVDGRVVATQDVVADGTPHDLRMTVAVPRSSWVALRVPYSSHTNPIWVDVDGQPFAVSAESVRWCLQCVDACWASKKGTYAGAELSAAEEAYERAREVYRRLLSPGS